MASADDRVFASIYKSRVHRLNELEGEDTVDREDHVI